MASANHLWHSLFNIGVINAKNNDLDSDAYCLAGFVLTVLAKNES